MCADTAAACAWTAAWLRQVGVGRHHDVAADVTAGGDGIDHRGVYRLHRGLEPGLDHAVELERLARGDAQAALGIRSEEHTSELQSLMRISYAVFCVKKKKQEH